MNKYIYLIILLLSALFGNAQLNPLGATFYQNQYLANPAMAGLTPGIHLNAGMNKQWSAVPGSPSTQFITLDRGSDRVGLGVNMYADKAGLLKRTRITATYAYHLPLNVAGDKLRFGLSLGALSERLAIEDIDGTISDIAAQRFNERAPVMDGDFGMAYTSGKLSLQGALPNLKNFLKKERYNTANWNTFYTAVSYKFMTDSSSKAFIIEPKVAYRGVRGYDDVIDGGVNFSIPSNKLSGTILYHSTNSISFGMGLNYNSFSILGMYTSGTSALKGYSSGNFEIGLGYNFNKKE
ncbi:MAG: type IX secretion system membrane protein PorP/SprF [Sphingobacteriaceae bacterium]|nr:MAG: type IX secretion system membrane protein PorP/SprF [Sphingobacteriaceae bacterium]